ncbi:hypothetical protein [Paenibacillus gorillae]|uniref:hypothetical protein n=1 Tax=Paenibacillus gorillae TaxID=1243662 RepID=UPI000694C061|nr:hypothetical protein [Paenibacillus gorillae]
MNNQDMWGISGLRKPEIINNEASLMWLQEELVTGVFECHLGISSYSNQKDDYWPYTQVDFPLENWSTENQVMLPGSVYGGNRFQARNIPYPPIFKDQNDLRKDLPVTVTNIARLNIGEGESELIRDTHDLSTPAIGIYFPSQQISLWLLLEHNVPEGALCIALTENQNRSKAVLSLRIPHKEAKSNNGLNSELHWVKLRAHVFHSNSVTEWIRCFAPIRKSMAEAQSLPSVIPFSAAWGILEEKYNQMNWEENEKYYSVGLRENHFQDWQSGWVGGGISTYPLLVKGNEQSKERAMDTIDFMFGTQTEAGLFHGIYSKGQYPGDGFDREDASRWHLVRKSGDVLYFVMKQLLLLEQQGEMIPSAWIEGTRRLADAFVVAWENNKQFGQFLDVHTGDIIVGGSTSGAIIPAGLMLASSYWQDERYDTVAREAAKLYVERDLWAGVTTGGPGEILQCPDSESAFALLESLVVLYESTGEEQWLTAAREAAHLCMTWCVSYDFRWPASAEFGRLDMKTTGTVLANAQNQHSAPGICTLSGDSLLKLFRATGDILYLELLRDIARTIPQYLSRQDRPIMSWDEEKSALPPGFVNERVNLSSWEGEDKVGGVFNGSCWSETALMLTIVEVPGLYVQPDTGLYMIFDHIGAELISNVQGSELTLRLSNDTNFTAKVSVLSETKTDTGTALGQRHIGLLPSLTLVSGASITVRFNTKGFQLLTGEENDLTTGLR